MRGRSYFSTSSCCNNYLLHASAKDCQELLLELTVYVQSFDSLLECTVPIGTRTNLGHVLMGSFIINWRKTVNRRDQKERKTSLWTSE